MTPGRRNAAVIGVICCGLAGCSSAQPDPKTIDQMKPGAAQVMVDGHAAAIEQRVRCDHNDFWTTLRVGNTTTNVTAVLHNSTNVIAESLLINDVGGFTGSYWTDLGGNAQATMKGATIEIQATATGFRTDHPSKRVTAPFQITAVC